MSRVIAAIATGVMLWGCGASSVPVAELQSGPPRDIRIALVDGRKIVFRGGEYRLVKFDSAYAIVGKGTQVEDRFGPSSIVLTDSIPSARIEDIETYNADEPEGPTGWYIDALKVIVPLAVVVGAMLL
jgi:hypothetical protein